MSMLVILLETMGGVGIFLYGMALMASSLEKAAGNKMKSIIEAFTRNRFFGVGVGALVTMIIQSSAATTVMIVGFVNAGIMTLLQATGVIMGANIGTTITAQLVAFNLDAAAPIMAGIAAICWIITNNKTAKNLLEVVIGLGILFMGISLLKGAMSWISEEPDVAQFIMQFSGETVFSYFVLLLAGMIITALVQSSSTVTGVMIAMASQGLLTIPMAVPLVLGSNVGTTVTSMLSSVGANRNAKRAACIHVLFNIIGVFLFVLILNKPVLFIVDLMGGDVARQIANVHTFFNVFATILLIPFAKFLVKAAERIIPIQENEVNKFETTLEARFLETPAIAISQVYVEIDKMSKMVRDNYNKSVKCLVHYKAEDVETIADTESAINFKQKEIKDYLQRLMQKDISAAQHREINMMYSITNDMERVGDHAENIAELATFRQEHKIYLSETAISQLESLNEYVRLSCDETLEVIQTLDTEVARDVVNREGIINELEKEYREGHMDRLNEGNCTAESGVVFLDAISNMERCADRLKKVGYVILDYGKTKEKGMKSV